MTSMLRKIKLDLHWAHWVILSLSLILTFSAWFVTSQKVKEKSRAEFQRDTQQILYSINERMKKYENALRGGAAFIKVVNNKIDLKAWREYAKHLNITKRYPGINGIGVIYDVPANQVKNFEKQQQKDRDYFKIYPAHRQSRFLPIVYIEPEVSNLKAVGLDMAHEGNRFMAALRAEKTGEPQITGPIVLVQDKQKTPGFLLFVPIYLSAKKESFIGFVYAPFIMNKLMKGIFSNEYPEVNVKITDSNEVVFNEDTTVKSKNYSPRYTKIVKKKIFGRTWQFGFSSTPSFDENNSSAEPIYILSLGLLIDVVLLILFISLTRTNRKAIEYTEQLTSDLSRKQKELSKIAHQDKLTKLPNRRHFFSILESGLAEASNKHTLLAVCIMDIDGFKQIIDAKGYDVADRLLKEFAKGLTANVPTAVSVARIGADEFGLIIPNIKSRAKINQYLDDFSKAISESQFIKNFDLPLTCCIGISIYPTNAEAAKELYNCADISVNKAKEQGKSQRIFYNEDLHHQVKRQHAIDFAMQKAIENEELTIAYQPQVDISTAKVVGLEALLRWDSGFLGSVGPDEFIPLAEDSGMIITFGHWLINQVSKDMTLMAESKALKNVNVSINASIVELLEQDYAETIASTLKQNQIDSSEITIEITESTLIANKEAVLQTLNSIKAIGCSLALDDFGTGFSSLQYLKELPVSLLKIDKTFIDELDDTDDYTIVKSVIDMAHGLELEVLAEGVETEKSLQWLKKAGCDYAQGFYFYRPMRLEDLLSVVR